MGLGVFVYLGWFAVVAAALVITGIHLARRGFKGVGAGIAAVTGALLNWAFVSAYIGAFEIDGYVGTKSFAITLAVGFVGVALFVLSCVKLKRKPAAA